MEKPEHDHQINTFEDTPKKPKPLACPFCGEKLQDTTFKEAIITCKEKDTEGEGSVFFLDNYQVTKTPPQWFKDMQAKKEGGGGCMLVLLSAVTIAAMLGMALLA